MQTCPIEILLPMGWPIEWRMPALAYGRHTSDSGYCCRKVYKKITAPKK